MLVDCQRFTSGRNNFVKQKHADLNLNGRDLESEITNSSVFMRILNTADDRYKCRRGGSPTPDPSKEPKIVLKYFRKTP